MLYTTLPPLDLDCFPYHVYPTPLGNSATAWNQFRSGRSLRDYGTDRAPALLPCAVPTRTACLPLLHLGWVLWRFCLPCLPYATTHHPTLPCVWVCCLHTHTRTQVLILYLPLPSLQDSGPLYLPYHTGTTFYLPLGKTLYFCPPSSSPGFLVLVLGGGRRRRREEGRRIYPNLSILTSPCLSVTHITFL